MGLTSVFNPPSFPKEDPIISPLTQIAHLSRRWVLISSGSRIIVARMLNQS